MPNLPLQFPLRGLTEVFPYAAKEPGFTFDCLNVRPHDTQQGRARGGKRPGTSRVIAYPVDLSITPVQRMKQITLASGTPIAGFDWDDPFAETGSGSDGEGGGGGWLRPAPDDSDPTYTDWPEADPVQPSTPPSPGEESEPSVVVGPTSEAWNDGNQLIYPPDFGDKEYRVFLSGVDVPAASFEGLYEVVGELYGWFRMSGFDDFVISPQPSPVKTIYADGDTDSVLVMGLMSPPPYNQFWVALDQTFFSTQALTAPPPGGELEVSNTYADVGGTALIQRKPD